MGGRTGGGQRGGVFIDWDDLQLNLPNREVPGQFYIANVGGARSSGVEIELNARPRSSIDVFATLGYTRARFKDGSFTSVDVSGNELPSTPGYTATAGAQLSRPIGTSRFGATLYGRAEAVFYGAFQYDDANTAGQEAYRWRTSGPVCGAGACSPRRG